MQTEQLNEYVRAVEQTQAAEVRSEMEKKSGRVKTEVENETTWSR